ncbi:hypothetical protein Pcinc_036179 [Petrolisthes cinctipes]|uniref:Uncharacterized protein n=1 Tax=Petrolisthes cinctipes TaxID=88211 RepID=A0AAE1EMU6_PETCI|nr:hypothetical protein Pcinc_036179 [Petrolisthes cinctipes]
MKGWPRVRDKVNKIKETETGRTGKEERPRRGNKQDWNERVAKSKRQSQQDKRRWNWKDWKERVAKSRRTVGGGSCVKLVGRVWYSPFPSLSSSSIPSLHPHRSHLPPSYHSTPSLSSSSIPSLNPHHFPPPPAPITPSPPLSSSSIPSLNPHRSHLPPSYHSIPTPLILLQPLSLLPHPSHPSLSHHSIPTPLILLYPITLSSSSIPSLNPHTPLPPFLQPRVLITVDGSATTLSLPLILCLGQKARVPIPLSTVEGICLV